MKKIGLFLLLSACLQGAQAVTVVLCEDSRGERSFQSSCPPGSTEVVKKEYRSGDAAATSGVTDSRPALVLYRVPDCQVCDQVNEFLKLREIPFTETDVSADILLQEKVKQLAGELQVPVLTVGETVIVGYNRPAMTEALTASGHMSPPGQ